MTTRKKPLSIESAIEAAALPLGGLTKASLAIGRERHVIPHAANPNKPDMVRLDDAVKLDQACYDAGGGTPILAYFQLAIEHTEGPRISYFDHAANTVRESAELTSEIMDALKDGKVSKSERRRILCEVQDLQEDLSALAADLEASK